VREHKKTRWLSLAAIGLAFGLIAAACGDSGSSTAAPAATAAPASTAAPAGVLSECSSPLVIQSDWFPEAEHGAAYNLVGDDYTVDVGTKIVKGSLVAGGVDTGIDIEVRTGGPAIGYTPVSSQMYTDKSIDIGFVSTDQVILLRDATPTISVMAPLEKNPQILMWDPATYPEVKTIADLKATGATINVFGGGTFISVFTNEGILDASQVDPSYDGSPARFIAEGGKIAQQGFASAEPYNYENVFTDWGKPVAFQLVHDAGLELYSQTLAIREADLASMTPCLEQFIPIAQQAAVDYYASPARANGIIIDAVAKYADFWKYDQGVADYSVKTQIDLGLASNGPDSTLGNMDPARVQSVIDKITAADPAAPAGLTAADIMTNQFIDMSIGMP